MRHGGRRRIGSFVCLTFLLTVPFFALGLTGVEVAPGLSIAALGVVCPALAAVLLSALESGRAGIRSLFGRALAVRGIRIRWILPAVLLFPMLLFVSAVLMVALGVDLPVPHEAPAQAIAMALVFVIAAFCEELGWSGYALAVAPSRWTTLGTALLIGLAWAAWHVIPYVQAHPSLSWVFWQCVQTVALRVIIVWLVVNARAGILVAVLCHASVNLADFLFPVDGSLYDPRFVAPVVVAVAAIVAAAWGPETLRGRRRIR